MKVDNYEDLVKCGYLEMKLPRKHRKLGRQAWRRKWFILRRKSSQGGPRLEYHKSEESCLNAQNKTVVELKTLTKIDDSNKSKSRSITFKLIFEDTFLTLSTQNTNNMNEWIRLIRKFVALPVPKPTPLLPVVEGSFQVTVIYTEDSESMNLAGEYLMVVTSEHLLLYRNSNVINRSDEVGRNGSDGKSRSTEVAKWDLDDIPRFRLQKLNRLNDAEKIFIVNLARTSQTTEGEFQFLTQNGRAILETVKSRIKQRSRNNEDSPRSSPVEEVANSNSSFGVEASRSRSCSGRSHISHQSIPDSTVSKVSSTSDREIPTRLVSSDFSTF
ncbi:uncharacterized protein LOC130613919 [Hydractinia symbiolongicarpus]|uniref:uncharacterized protein LOC130613919 n=1 Tax=Hydractinia symbiolongicarpus TaxID=13093 RepID=UPI002549D00A|nr:uncharacterized protein LOC130613919 [Hydractinia symbiolongicarpus]